MLDIRHASRQFSRPKIATKCSEKFGLAIHSSLEATARDFPDSIATSSRSAMTIPSILPRLSEAEDAYARSVIEADLIRRQQLTSIQDFMTGLSSLRHDGGLTLECDDLTLTLNREETRLEMRVLTEANLVADQPSYRLILEERWAKTMKRPAVELRPRVKTSSEQIIERMMRMYLRFRNDIQTFEHDLAVAQRTRSETGTT
jgi:hypothetical protein